MDQARGTSRMWWGLGLQLCLGVVLSANPGFGSTASEALVARQSVSQQEQQVAPLVVPQWWWLSSLLSLPHGHHPHTTTAAAARKVAAETNESPASEGEASTLSLVLPLDQLAAADDSVHSLPGAGRVAKRGSVCRGSGRKACQRGAVATIPASEVQQNWDEDYLSIPKSLVSFSQKQAEEIVCKDLSVQLFRVDLRELRYLEPVWMRETVHLGVCPSMLQRRGLGQNVWPPSVVEVKCLCQRDSSCSNLGGDFRCQAVRRSVRTWVRHSNQNFVPSQESVSVGCVCVQRTAMEAKHSNLVEG